MVSEEIRGNKLRDMIIYLTSDCNLSCKHCFLPKIKPKRELTLQDLQWIHDTFDIKNVNLMGGEPFLYPYLHQAIDMFDRITLTTNGVFLASGSSVVDSYIEQMKKKGDKISVQLSIEGMQKTTDEIRGPGVFRKVLDTAQLLKENDISCYLRCSYGLMNLKQIPDLIDTIAQPLGVPLVLFPLIGPAPLPADEQIWLFNLIMEKNRQYNAKHAIDQPHFIQWLGEHRGRCSAGGARLSVTYNKEIIPCHFDFDYILGRIGDSLGSINANREMFLKLKMIQPSCDFCEHAEVCRSGCYVANSHVGCPLKRNFTLERYALMHDIDAGSLGERISDMKGLLKDSLIC